MNGNAIGGGLTALLCLNGFGSVVAGRRELATQPGMRRGVGWKRMNWELHSAVGFWSFAIVFMWGTTGFYFVYPQPFRATIEVFTPINPPRAAAQPRKLPQASTHGTGPRRRRRPLTLGGKILRDFSSLHYGNFGGWPLKALYVLLGFVPVVLLGSALMMWWNRVLAPAFRRVTSSQQQTNSWGSSRARRASRPPTV